MEYESRQVKWYWLSLFVLFCVGAVYLLFSGNPYLYSHIELRSALTSGDVLHRQTIPAKPHPLEKVGPATFTARYNLERTALDPIGSPRNRSYEEFKSYPVALGLTGFDVVHITSDSSGFYLSGKNPYIVRVALDGSVAWRYRFSESPGDRAMGPVLLDEVNAYLIHPTGEVVCLDKISGRIRWIMDVAQEVVAAPIIWGKNLVLPVKNKTAVQIIQIRRNDGQVESTTAKLDVKPGFILSYSPMLEMFIATVDNKVIAIDPEDWSVAWSQTMTDPVKGHAVLVDHQIFVATLGAKIIKLDGNKKGKIEWEADLEKPPASPPSYLPIMHKLALLDTTGYMSVVDMKTGKIAWRQSVENRNPSVETWSARLKGTNIEEFKMDWLHKGWTIWSPCAERKICIFTPGKGQMIQRFALSGAPLALPLALEREWLFLTQTKPGHLAVSRLVEESELKKLKAASN